MISLENAPCQRYVTDLAEERPREVFERTEEDMVDGAGHKIRKSLEESVDAYGDGTSDLAPDWRQIEAVATRCTKDCYSSSS